jgi:hypothetical protein
MWDLVHTSLISNSVKACCVGWFLCTAKMTPEKPLKTAKIFAPTARFALRRAFQDQDPIQNADAIGGFNPVPAPCRPIDTHTRLER